MVNSSLTSPDPATEEPAPSAPASRPRPHQVSWALAAIAGGVMLVAVILVLLVSGGGGVAAPATGAAALVPSDALAYVNVSLDRGRPAVRQALTLAGRLPDYPLASAAVQTRLGAIIAGGRTVDFAGQIEPWLGNEAALALLNTPSATAGSLIVMAVTDHEKAAAFLRQSGAVAHGSYRGTALLAYPKGTELGFVKGFLVLGQDASVRSAIDVAAGSTPSLQGSSLYKRAAAGEPTDRILDAYASLAGVRRVLAAQSGVAGALGDLLYQPALQGVTVSLSPRPGGARLVVHSALDPSLARLSPPATSSFAPTLQNVMPTGSILMLDVTGLDRVAPTVLNAGSAAGVAGGIGPLLSRLGTALGSEGVNVKDVVSIFHHETAVAIVPHAGTPTLVIVARAPDQSHTAAELAQLEIPLAQLFEPSPDSSGAGKEALFNDRQVAGITAHQLALANGLQLDYAVSGGLVMISTSLDGIAAVAQRQHTLAHDPSFEYVLGHSPKAVTSMVYVDLAQLLTLGEQTGLTSSARFRAILGDLDKVRAIGLSSTRAPGETTATLSVRVPSG